MAYNHAISSDDPQAIEKLTAKLEKCQQDQERMKSVNAYYRRHGTMRGYPGMTDEQADKINYTIEHSYSWDKRPYSSYLLSNNNAEIRRLKQRIEQLSHDKEVGFVGWEFEGGEAVANTDNNRLQLLFDEKPGAEQRTILKQNGFHWSPSEQAWQRQLNDNAVYACNRIDFVQPLDGQKPTALQPKPKKKDAPER